MLKINLTIILVFFLINTGTSYSGDRYTEEGLYFIKNYSRKEYSGATQNWAIVQDRRGVMYFGNNEGVLEYDGVSWRKIITANRTGVRSLAMDSNGTIYVGAQNDFGYLATDSSGQIRYVSLTGKLPDQQRNFADVWAIAASKDGVYFRTANSLFFYDPSAQHFKTWKPKKRFQSLFCIHDHILIVQREIGLMRLEADSFRLIPGGEIFSEEMIYAMIPFLPFDPRNLNRKVLIGTRNMGLYTFDGKILAPFKTEVDSLISKSQIYHGAALPDGCFALATLYNGVIIIDQKGRLRKILDKSSGLINQCVRHVSIDRQGGLWMGLDDGIARVEISSPFTTFDETSGLKGKIYSVIRHQGTLYTSTSLGVHYLDQTFSGGKTRKSRIEFRTVPGTASMCWSLLSAGSFLFVATTGEGVFRIQSGKAFPVTKRIAFCLHRSSRDSNMIYVGLKDGLAILRFVNGKWTDEGKADGIDDEIRSIMELKDGRLWLGTYYNGLLQCTPDPGFSVKQNRWITERYGEEQGLPRGGVNVFPFAGREIIAARHGLYRFDETSRRFIADSSFGNLFSDTTVSVARIKEDTNGNAWISLQRNDHYALYQAIRQDRKSYSVDQKSFQRFFDFFVTEIYPDHDGIVWFGGPDGLIRYNSGIKQPVQDNFSALIRRVTIGKDSLIYSGSALSPEQGSNKSSEFIMRYNHNNIRFEYAAPSYDRETENRFQYMLTGHDDDWSAWTKENIKEYTNISEGRYRFHIRAKNIDGRISGEDVFEFSVLPPLYRTWWAYLLYALGLMASIFGIVHWWSQRLLREKNILETLVQQRTADLALKEQQLEKIDLIVRSINTKFRLDDFLNSLLNEIGFIEKIQNAGVLMHDPYKNIYRFACTRGWNIVKLAQIELTPEETEDRYAPIPKQVAEDIFLISNPGSDSASEKFSHLVSSQSMLVLRIQNKGQKEGYIIFDRMRDEEPFTDADILLLSNLRQHILSGFLKAQLLTHLEEANTELQKLNDKKSEFLGFAAHDLRNPLGAIISFVELLVQDLKENRFNVSEAVTDLEMVLNSARQMVRLISELLDISAIESGKVNLELQRYNLNHIFEECERIHRKQANMKNIRLVIDKNNSLPALLIDKSLIAEVVDNLLSNAIKYTYPEGEVKLYTEVHPGEVLVHVSDSGQGLNENDLKEIFVNFRKLSARPTGGESSTGFGLAIVKKIVELHRGRVWVDSKINQGSTFSFSIPLPVK